MTENPTESCDQSAISEQDRLIEKLVEAVSRAMAKADNDGDDFDWLAGYAHMARAAIAAMPKVEQQAARSIEVVFQQRDALAAENARLREALTWYGEQARLARLITREGDARRNALDADGGKRARAALTPEPDTTEGKP